ncbi:hypothetical protein Ddye_001965 [Dipteronia dyeriana]|uniref:Uncharacterized protein n=1 Tax=Dipteronia dyeriana TaxID=168575 RepID=A0AAD9XPF6_9ROSI|nr:hypothetical protein Ddye_001965 [Dipteronia dyeriana]
MVLTAPTLDENLTMKHLMSASGGWDVGFLRENFSKKDFEAILSLLVGVCQAIDSRIWHYEQTGCYTVMSGYRVGCAVLGSPSSSDFMLECFGRLSDEDTCLLCVVLWRNWGHRNLVAHGLPGLCLNDVVSWSQAYLRNFRAAKESRVRDVISVQKRAVRWTPPRPDRYKLNTDMAIYGARAAGRIGLVIRDLDGFVTASSS